ncbi:MAG: hypothetical protein WCB49_09930 [Gammaproteobacteria bacterium]
MLYEMIKNEGYTNLMRKHIQELILFLFEQEQNFGILCRVEHLTFEPPLPESIRNDFRPMTLFFLAGYTFESARLDNNALIFEAGFGEENIGSFVQVPLLSIMQVIVDETPIFVNLASPKETVSNQPAKKENGIENSMASFLSNPENQKFIKD